MSDESSAHDREPGSGTERLRETAEEAGRAAGEKWEKATHEAWETATGAAEEARKHAEREAERGKRAGAGQVHQWASALDRAAAELGPDTMQGRFLHQASEGLDDVARSIEGRSVGEMVGAVAEFGRRNPLAFVGSAMIAGFALARFATATREDEAWDEPGPAAGRPDAPAAARSPAGSGPRPATPTASGGGSGPTTAPATASAPTGAGRPYPSAGPVPGQGGNGGND